MLSKRWIGFCIRALSSFHESLSLKENIIWPISSVPETSTPEASALSYKRVSSRID